MLIGPVSQLLSPRGRLAVRVLACCLVLGDHAGAAEGVLPRVASVNLCTDQLVLTLAEPGQIATLSWLAADAAESMLAADAERYALNYGSAEEILRFGPDVVVGGAFTNGFTRRLLADQGFEVVAVEPAASIADVERNLRLVAAAIGRPEQGRAVIEAMRHEVERLQTTRREPPVDAVVIRPGGFTVGRNTLADEIMTLAGLNNVAAEQGLDRWGSLAMETLLSARAQLLIFASYRDDQPSLANAVLEHPALARAERNRLTASIPSSYWSCGLPSSLESAWLIREALGPPARAAR